MIDPWRAEALAATLDRPPPTEVLPPLWHWIYLLEAFPTSNLGPEGHPRPPDLPIPEGRRMIAGGEVAFHGHVPLGEEATRRSRLLGVEEKEGRSGRLTFVRLGHRTEARATLLVEEEQRIVYLSAPPRPDLPQGSPPDWPWRRVFVPDELVLFRFSALTFNSHRIHYDRRYTTEVEGHPDLVVHGPLIALLLADLAHERVGELVHFSFRATAPLYVNRPITLVGRPTGGDGAELEAWSDDGRRAMVALARFNPRRAPSKRGSRPGAG